MSRKPKTWIITGCSSGFGMALAEAALERGDKVMLTARNPDQLAETVGRYPGLALSARLDVTDANSVSAVVVQTEDAFGQVDVFVNNAGYGVIGAVEEVSADEYRRMFETNVFGVIEATRVVLPALRRSKGRIVNMSSGAGIFTRAGFGLYSSTKFGVEAISEALAQEVAPFGIKVLIVEPGAFRTEFLGRSMQIAERRLDIYDGTASNMRDYSSNMSGAQPGDPKRGVQVILAAVDSENPPLRLPLGPDAHRNIRAKLQSVAADMDAMSALSLATDFVDEARS